MMKHVVFDLGKVLVDWDPRYLFVDHIGMSSADAERFLAEVCSPAWHIEFDRGRTFNDGIQELLDTHPRHRSRIERYALEWPRMFAGPIDSTVAQLRRLHAADVRLHALSNYPPQQIRFLYERFDFMSLFDTVMISGLLGVVKPDPEIFRRLFASIGSDSCVFIDDREENIETAAALGMQVVHFTPAEGAARIDELLASLNHLD
jgi:2-haloacid dehalogenase